ncbi:MAG TPA: hypothetical protein VK988_05015 [Acidimicrobiales bacterium]|nr:hypothetical protein [Acidimicrobiales bacterium]
MAGRGIVDGDEDLLARGEELAAQLVEARDDLARHAEELRAAREINRSLLARLNQRRS